VELRQLRYFVAVAESGHFGKAAEQLGVAQSVLSRQIQRLERELGAELLRRLPRVRLTEAGLAFVQHAREILARAEVAALDAARAHRGEVARLRIGYVQTVLHDGRLQALCAAFRRLHPDVELQLQRLQAGDAVDAVAALADGLLDVAFVLLTHPVGAGLVAEPLQRQEWVVLLPPSHPLAGRERVRTAELRGEPLVTFERAVAPALHDEYVAALRAAGLEAPAPHPIREASDIYVLVAAGDGVSVNTRALAALAPPGLAAVPLTDFALPLWVHCVRRAGEPSRALADFLRITRAMRGDPAGWAGGDG
jgi:DNA-binding transcriptional LysR family regulator